MSQENVEIIRRATDAWNRRDMEDLLALTDPDAEHVNSPTAIEPGTRRGTDELAEVTRGQWEALTDGRAEIDRIYDRGEEVIVLGRACRQAREERGVVQVKIAAEIEVNQATIARFEDGTAWPRQPEEVLMAYASVLEMDMRLLWLRAFVLWLENEPVLDKQSKEQIRAALKRLKI